MYLGLDLGTSGVKAVLVDADGTVAATAETGLSVSRPGPGWSEQDPDGWIAAVEASLAALSRDHGHLLGALRGIGLSGQMHGATLLDAADRPLRPAILWNDTRSHEEAARLDAMPEFRAITGNIVFPGFTAPKLVWVRENEPAIFDKVAKVLLPKDFVRLWLTGEHVSDMSDASGTAWLDVAERRWSASLLAACGLSAAHMPRLVEGTDMSGRVRPEVAARFGIPQDAVVAGGAGDNAASACGMGVVREGQSFVSLGTSGVLFSASDTFRPNPASAVHAFCHALPGAWHQMGVILSATDSLNWLSNVAGQDAVALSRAAGETLRAPTGPVFLPYLSGERTPHNDAAIRGAFVGLGHESDAGALARAVMEGVAFALRDNLDALSAAGTRIDRVIAVGGGSRSAYWLKAIATVLGIPVELAADGDHGAALGAARLGLVAAENADPDSVCTRPPVARIVEPEAQLMPAFREAHARYRALYPAIKGVFQ